VAGDGFRRFHQYPHLRRIRQAGTRGTRDDFKDGEPEVREIEVEEIVSEAKIRKLEADYLEVAKGGSAVAIQGVKDFFDRANEGIRWVKRARRDAEPSHLQSLFDFAARAYRRPLSPADRADLAVLLSRGQERYGLDHEGAIREAIVLVLTSPNFSTASTLSKPRRNSAAIGFRSGQPAQLLPVVEHARRGTVAARRGRRPAQAGGHQSPGATDAARPAHPGAWRSNSEATGWTFAISEQIGTVDRERFPSFSDD
jgi:hypothetical protein